jgi:hypothetical protein
VQPLAIGTASSHTDSFGERIEGTVTNPTSRQRYHLEAAYHVVVLPDGTVKVLSDRFVHLTPIGG